MAMTPEELDERNRTGKESAGDKYQKPEGMSDEDWQKVIDSAKEAYYEPDNILQGENKHSVQWFIDNRLKEIEGTRPGSQERASANAPGFEDWYGDYGRKGDVQGGEYGDKHRETRLLDSGRHGDWTKGQTEESRSRANQQAATRLMYGRAQGVGAISPLMQQARQEQLARQMQGAGVGSHMNARNAMMQAMAQGQIGALEGMDKAAAEREQARQAYASSLQSLRGADLARLGLDTNYQAQQDDWKNIKNKVGMGWLRMGEKDLWGNVNETQRQAGSNLAGTPGGMSQPSQWYNAIPAVTNALASTTSNYFGNAPGNSNNNNSNNNSGSGAHVSDDPRRLPQY